MSYASTEQINDFYGSGMQATALSVVSGIAADVVADLSKIPDPVPEDYAKRAARAELLVGNWLVTNGYGTLKSTSLSGVSSDSFASLDEVKRLAATALGGYYAGGTNAGVAYVSSFPIGRG